MAEEVDIAGTEAKAKIRNLWAVAILPIVTLNAYMQSGLNGVWEKHRSAAA